MPADNDNGAAGSLRKHAIFTSLEPGYLTVMRVYGAILSTVLISGSLAIVSIINSKSEQNLPYWVAGVLLFVPAFWLTWVSPKRRFAAWGYRLERDELCIKRGVLTHEETTVPLGRVQHIDVGQGVIERGCGVSYLALHTAGMDYNVVKLPGLTRQTAESLRDEIRTHIRTDIG